METQLDMLQNGQIVHELKKYFTADQLDEAKDEIDSFVQESSTLEELISRVREHLDSDSYW